MSLDLFIPFLIATAILLATPGPTILLVVSYALAQGRGVALAVVGGVILGDLLAMSATLLGLGEGDVVVHPTIAYPTYAVGALIAGATPLPSDDPENWPAETRLVWLNSPGNPDGHIDGIDYLRRAVERARHTVRNLGTKFGMTLAQLFQG